MRARVLGLCMRSAQEPTTKTRLATQLIAEQAWGHDSQNDATAFIREQDSMVQDMLRRGVFGDVLSAKESPIFDTFKAVKTVSLR